MWLHLDDCKIRRHPGKEFQNKCWLNAPVLTDLLPTSDIYTFLFYEVGGCNKKKMSFMINYNISVSINHDLNTEPDG